MKKTLVIFFVICFQIFYSQEKQFKCEKVYDAVKLIDDKKYSEAISILRECEKIDPEDFTYPYEIALAYTDNKQYQEAIDQLLKVKDYKNINEHYFQLLGNNYDYINDSKKAVMVYDDGLKKFPDAGRLYLEKGVILESENKHREAISVYEKGISVAPMYSSNYYRVSKIYLNSSDKLSGLIYGEIFMNLERTTGRTIEMSKLLYDTYKSSVTIASPNEKKIDFCDVVINVEKFDVSKKLPFCAIFAKSFILATVSETKVDLASLSRMRIDFLKNYYQEDYKNYPNVLIDYHKKLLDNGLLKAYNYYIFQKGGEEEFKKWYTAEKSEYEKFVSWYTSNENYLNIDKANLFISDSVK